MEKEIIEESQINEDGKAYNMRDKVLWVPVIFIFLVALIVIF